MDIKVNESEWFQASDEDREKIKKILDNFYKEKHNIVPEQSLASSASFANPLCKAACDIAEAGAVAACAGLSGPAMAVCIAAAHAAGEYCRSRC